MDEIELTQAEELNLKEQELQEAMREKKDNITRLWNAFIDSLIAAEKSWKGISDELVNFNTRDIERLPQEVQKGLSKYRRDTFVMMLPDFLGHAKAYGGLEVCKTKLEKEE